MAAVAPAFAVTDGFTYETIDGITCKNLWIDSRFQNLDGWNALPFAEQYAKARTACLGQYNGNDVIIVGFSQTLPDGETTNDFAHLVLVDFTTGNVIKTVQMTANGEPVKGLLCANQVGCDQFGHVWFAGYVASNYNSETETFTPLRIYVVDDMDDGTCHVAAELNIPDDETEAAGRYDYCDLVGDITLQNAGCTVMTVIASGTAPWVIAWTCEQGGTEWEGGMDGYYSAPMTETYPADQSTWSYAPMVRIVVNEEYSNELFYVDGFTTCPTLYNNSGAMVNSFAEVNTEEAIIPAVGTNGVGEFVLGGKNFIAYSLSQYEAEYYCAIAVADLGENMEFSEMKNYWVLPKDGLGDTGDSGTRIHAIETKIYQDASGKEGAYVLTYKCNNGLGVYSIAQEGFEAPEQGGVNDIVADNSGAAVEYFNMQGVRVANPAAGQLVIKRQGSEVSKVLVK